LILQKHRLNNFSRFTLSADFCGALNATSVESSYFFAQRFFSFPLHLVLLHHRIYICRNMIRALGLFVLAGIASAFPVENGVLVLDDKTFDDAVAVRYSISIPYFRCPKYVSPYSKTSSFSSSSMLLGADIARSSPLSGRRLPAWSMTM
jgi:hypothetical protein